MRAEAERAAERAAAESAAALRVLAEKAVAERAAENAAAARAAAEQAVAERAAADSAATEGAAENAASQRDKAAAERAAENAAAELAAAERAAANAAAERAVAERAAVERAAENAAAERALAEKAVAGRALAERSASERAAAERGEAAAANKAAVTPVASKRLAVERAATERAEAARLEAEMTPATERAAAQREEAEAAETFAGMAAAGQVKADGAWTVERPAVATEWTTGESHAAPTTSPVAQRAADGETHCCPADPSSADECMAAAAEEPVAVTRAATGQDHPLAFVFLATPSAPLDALAHSGMAYTPETTLNAPASPMSQSQRRKSIGLPSTASGDKCPSAICIAVSRHFFSVELAIKAVQLLASAFLSRKSLRCGLCGCAFDTSLPAFLQSFNLRCLVNESAPQECVRLCRLLLLTADSCVSAIPTTGSSMTTAAAAAHAQSAAALATIAVEALRTALELVPRDAPTITAVSDTEPCFDALFGLTAWNDAWTWSSQKSAIPPSPPSWMASSAIAAVPGVAPTTTWESARDPRAADAIASDALVATMDVVRGLSKATIGSSGLTASPLGTQHQLRVNAARNAARLSRELILAAALSFSQRSSSHWDSDADGMVPSQPTPLLLDYVCSFLNRVTSERQISSIVATRSPTAHSATEALSSLAAVPVHPDVEGSCLPLTLDDLDTVRLITGQHGPSGVPSSPSAKRAGSSVLGMVLPRGLLVALRDLCTVTAQQAVLFPNVDSFYIADNEFAVALTECIAAAVYLTSLTADLASALDRDEDAFVSCDGTLPPVVSELLKSPHLAELCHHFSMETDDHGGLLATNAHVAEWLKTLLDVLAEAGDTDVTVVPSMSPRFHAGIGSPRAAASRAEGQLRTDEACDTCPDEAMIATRDKLVSSQLQDASVRGTADHRRLDNRVVTGSRYPPTHELQRRLFDCYDDLGMLRPPAVDKRFFIEAFAKRRSKSLDNTMKFLVIRELAKVEPLRKAVLEAAKAIEAREAHLESLRAIVSRHERFPKFFNAGFCESLISSHLDTIRDASVQVMDAITKWRSIVPVASNLASSGQGPGAPQPFFYRNVNYVAKMQQDLKFLTASTLGKYCALDVDNNVILAPRRRRLSKTISERAMRLRNFTARMSVPMHTLPIPRSAGALSSQDADVYDMQLATEAARKQNQWFATATAEVAVIALHESTKASNVNRAQLRRGHAGGPAAGRPSSASVLRRRTALSRYVEVDSQLMQVAREALNANRSVTPATDVLEPSTFAMSLRGGTGLNTHTTVTVASMDRYNIRCTTAESQGRYWWSVVYYICLWVFAKNRLASFVRRRRACRVLQRAYRFHRSVKRVTPYFFPGRASGRRWPKRSWKPRLYGSLESPAEDNLGDDPGNNCFAERSSVARNAAQALLMKATQFAIKIQRVFRAFALRKRFADAARAVMAVLRLQSFIRHHWCVLMFRDGLQQWRAAVQLQRFSRRRSMRRRIQLRVQRGLLCTVIQSFARRRLSVQWCLRRALRHAAAIAILAAWRDWRHRVALALRRATAIVVRHLYFHDASLAIERQLQRAQAVRVTQKFARGMLAKAELRQRRQLRLSDMKVFLRVDRDTAWRQAATVIAAAYRSHRCRRTTVVAARLERRNQLVATHTKEAGAIASKLQRWWRSAACRYHAHLREQFFALWRCQTTFLRRWRHQCALIGVRRFRRLQQRIADQKEVAHRKRQLLDHIRSIERVDAATKIQSSWRGYIARKDFLVALQWYYDLERRALEEQTRVAAARRLARCLMGVLKRVRLGRHRSYVRSRAASKIQRVWRTFIQDRQETRRLFKWHRRRVVAAFTIQTCWRAFQALCRGEVMSVMISRAARSATSTDEDLA